MPEDELSVYTGGGLAATVAAAGGGTPVVATVTEAVVTAVSPAVFISVTTVAAGVASISAAANDQGLPLTPPKLISRLNSSVLFQASHNHAMCHRVHHHIYIVYWYTTNVRQEYIEHAYVYRRQFSRQYQSSE